MSAAHVFLWAQPLSTRQVSCDSVLRYLVQDKYLWPLVKYQAALGDGENEKISGATISQTLPHPRFSTVSAKRPRKCDLLGWGFLAWLPSMAPEDK